MSKLASVPSRPVVSVAAGKNGGPAADQASDVQEDAAGQPPAEAAGKRDSAVRRFVSRRAVVMLLAASIVLNAVGFVVVASTWKRSEAGHAPAEYPLGAYRYLGSRYEPGRVASAEFALHVAAAPGYGEQACSVLEAHKFRLRQGIEELLRRTSPKEFDDIGLRQLKRSIRSRIEEILDTRLVDDVIVTDLVIRWKSLEAHPADIDRGSPPQAEAGQLSQGPHDSAPSQQ